MKENKKLKNKVLHVKTGLLKKYEEDIEHEFNDAHKNKFLYNIDLQEMMKMVLI